MENQKLINFLNQLLSNYYVMNVKMHRYHWFIQGRHFFQLHGIFKEMYEMFAEDLDSIAERILMIEGRPLATMQKYLDETSLVEASADDEEDEIAVQLVTDLKQIVKEIKEVGLELSETVDDPATADVLTTLITKLEKYAWMFQAFLAKEEK